MHHAEFIVNVDEIIMNCQSVCIKESETIGKLMLKTKGDVSTGNFYGVP